MEPRQHAECVPYTVLPPARPSSRAGGPGSQGGDLPATGSRRAEPTVRPGRRGGPGAAGSRNRRPRPASGESWATRATVGPSREARPERPASRISARYSPDLRPAVAPRASRSPSMGGTRAGSPSDNRVRTEANGSGWHGARGKARSFTRARQTIPPGQPGGPPRSRSPVGRSTRSLERSGATPRPGRPCHRPGRSMSLRSMGSPKTTTDREGVAQEGPIWFVSGVPRMYAGITGTLRHGEERSPRNASGPELSPRARRDLALREDRQDPALPRGPVAQLLAA